MIPIIKTPIYRSPRFSVSPNCAVYCVLNHSQVAYTVKILNPPVIIGTATQENLIIFSCPVPLGPKWPEWQGCFNTYCACVQKVPNKGWCWAVERLVGNIVIVAALLRICRSKSCLQFKNHLDWLGSSFGRSCWDTQRARFPYNTYYFFESHYRHTFLLAAGKLSLCLSDNTTLRCSTRKDGKPGIERILQDDENSTDSSHIWISISLSSSV